MTVVYSCKSSDAVISQEDVTALETVKAILDTRAYEMEINTVYPMNTMASTQAINGVLLRQTGNSATRIDVAGDNHRIKIKDSTVEGYLPFFGETRMSTGSYNGGSGGVNLDGKTKDYSLSLNAKKNIYVVKFTTTDSEHNTESYNVQITAFPNKTVEVNVTSSHRTAIRYSGVLSAIKLEE